MPDSVPVEIDRPFDRIHWRLARAACLRIAAAIPPGSRLLWSTQSDGTLDPVAVDTWDRVSADYLCDEVDCDDAPHAICGFVLSSDPVRWQREIDAVAVGLHVAIVAPLEILCDPARWDRIRSKPHTLIATGAPVGVALVTRGRWPSDRQMRLVLV